MKRFFCISICSLCIVSLTSLHANDDIDQLGKQTDDLYRVGAASEDGSYTALSSSMLGWGIAIGIGIGILAAVLHSSTAQQK